ncbi:hypothetical protein DRF75_02250 [Ehrlichia minasensis]|uniref:Uncharacterized protein n=1 Tax=Ehrlichia minasensis TaxID=1242993 RepID=A0A4Q6I4M5_9RICK|nr:hypothetical protein [Ehrlichia minasensis]RZB12822.1 hypothetical protein DRF75_02250 [Ehrlichia minasensis]
MRYLNVVTKNQITLEDILLEILLLTMINIALQNNNIIMIKTLTITVLKHNQKTNNHVIIDTTDSSSDTIPTPTFDTPAKSNIFGILEEKLFK